MTKLLSALLKGAWSGATAYTVGDIVTLAGSSYICTANHTNQTPPNASYWALLAQAGEDGEDGVDGEVTLSTPQTITGKKTFQATVATITAATDGGTVTFNMNSSNIHTVTLGGNRTLAVANVAAGQGFIIRLVQDGTGSRTVTWFATIKWPSNTPPTLTTTANKTDVFGFLCMSSGNFDGYILGQNL